MVEDEEFDQVPIVVMQDGMNLPEWGLKPYSQDRGSLTSCRKEFKHKPELETEVKFIREAVTHGHDLSEPENETPLYMWFVVSMNYSLKFLFCFVFFYGMGMQH